MEISTKLLTEHTKSRQEPDTAIQTGLLRKVAVTNIGKHFRKYLLKGCFTFKVSLKMNFVYELT